ncbi:hypothetical protein [Mycobacterium colombiense]|uniref:hypothetical protein n=1 Tax=Mycobacterium colombiense TaxID=339268 RepID=UPI0012DB430A|nr:hypothetical protein [Mycobacterium colombiense]
MKFDAKVSIPSTPMALDWAFFKAFGQFRRPIRVEQNLAARSGVDSPDRDHSGPQNQRAAVSDKSPRKTMAKKSGQSLKEKRAAKRLKAAQSSPTEPLLHTKKS